MKCPARDAFLHLADNWPVSNSRNPDEVGLIEKAYRSAGMYGTVLNGMESVGGAASSHR